MVNTKNDLFLKDSLNIINSGNWLVFIVFLLTVFLKFPLFFGVLLSLGLIKLYFLSGIFCTFIEICSGEDVIIQFKNILKNSNRYCFTYLLIILIFAGIYFLLVFLFPPFKIIPLGIFLFHTNLINLYLFANIIIRKKYNNFIKQSFKIPIISGNFFKFLGLNVLHLVIFYFGLFNSSYGFISNLVLFSTIYINFLIFIIICQSILNANPSIKKHFSSQKDIYLISTAPGQIFTFFFQRFSYCGKIPSIFSVVKALSSDEYRYKEFSRVTWHNRYYKKNILVVITSFSWNISESYKLAKEFKRRGAKVVMEGSHVWFMAEEALEFCDSVIIGESEGVWKDIINDYENNSLKKEYHASSVENYFDLVFEKISEYEPSYVRYLVEISRGCKYDCHFCMVAAMCKGRARNAPVDKIVELTKLATQNIKFVHFNTNNVYQDKAHAKELFSALIPLNIKWSGFCSLDIAKDDEALELAKESGCKILTIGFEVPDKSAEIALGGKFSMTDRYVEYARKIESFDINICAGLVFGFESDSLKTLFTFWKFCLRLNPSLLGFSILTPYPGTKLYEEMLEQDRIINLNWDKYGGTNLVFKHPHLNNFFISMLFQRFIPGIIVLTATKTGWIFLPIIIGTVVTLINFIFYIN